MSYLVCLFIIARRQGGHVIVCAQPAKACGKTALCCEHWPASVRT